MVGYTTDSNMYRCLGVSRTPHPRAVLRDGLSAIFARVYFCYLDESGGCEPPDLGPEATPAMVITGLIIEASQVPALTRDFLAVKRRFFPGRFTQGPALDHVLTEIKGSEILQMTRSASRNKRRQADLIRSALLDLVEAYGCRLARRPLCTARVRHGPHDHPSGAQALIALSRRARRRGTLCLRSGYAARCGT